MSIGRSRISINERLTEAAAQLGAELLLADSGFEDETPEPEFTQESAPEHTPPKVA